SGERILRWSRRNRGGAAAIVIAGLGLAAVLVLLVLLLQESGRRNHDLRESVRATLAAVPRLRNIAGASRAMDELLPTALRQSKTLLRATPNDLDLLRTRAELLEAASLTPMVEGRVDDAAPLRIEAMGVRERMARLSDPESIDDRLSRSITMVLLGDVAKARGELESADRAFSYAQEVQAEVADAHPEVRRARLLLIESRWRRSVLAFVLGRDAEAEAQLEGMITAIRSELAATPDDPALLEYQWRNMLQQAMRLELGRRYVEAASLTLATLESARHALPDRPGDRELLLSICRMAHGAAQRFRLGGNLGQARSVLEVGRSLVDALERADPANVQVDAIRIERASQEIQLAWMERDLVGTMSALARSERLARRLRSRDPRDLLWQQYLDHLGGLRREIEAIERAPALRYLMPRWCGALRASAGPNGEL
ncbi:MAG: hypothetical protein KDA22_14165, partial [Phycisphaerales bacterium]|nr:hypothetical protein [Phycisphaerales bacterium]